MQEATFLWADWGRVMRFISVSYWTDGAFLGHQRQWRKLGVLNNENSVCSIDDRQNRPVLLLLVADCLRRERLKIICGVHPSVCLRKKKTELEIWYKGIYISCGWHISAGHVSGGWHFSWGPHISRGCISFGGWLSSFIGWWLEGQHLWGVHRNQMHLSTLSTYPRVQIGYRHCVPLHSLSQLPQQLPQPNKNRMLASLFQEPKTWLPAPFLNSTLRTCLNAGFWSSEALGKSLVWPKCNEAWSLTQERLNCLHIFFEFTRNSDSPCSE